MKSPKLTRFGRYYDVQRAKVYAWEKTIYIPNSPPKSIQELSLLMKTVLKDERDLGAHLPRQLTLKVMNPQKYVGTTFGTTGIGIAKNALYQCVLLHEVAHLLNPPPNASHGYEFLMTYIYLQTKYNKEELKFKTFPDLLYSAQQAGLTVKKSIDFS